MHLRDTLLLPLSAYRVSWRVRAVEVCPTAWHWPIHPVRCRTCTVRWFPGSPPGLMKAGRDSAAAARRRRMAAA